MKSLTLKRTLLSLVVIMVFSGTMVRSGSNQGDNKIPGTVYNAALGAYVPLSQATTGQSISIPGASVAVGGSGANPGQAIAVPGRAFSSGPGATSIGGTSVAVAGSSGLGRGLENARPLTVVGTGGVAVGILPTTNNFDDRPKSAASKVEETKVEKPSSGFAYQVRDNQSDFSLSLDNSPNTLDTTVPTTITAPVTATPLSTLSTPTSTAAAPPKLVTSTPPTSLSPSTSKTASQILAALEISRGTSLATTSTPTVSTASASTPTSTSISAKPTTSLFSVTNTSSTTTASTNSVQAANLASVSTPSTVVNPKIATLAAAGLPLTPNPPGSVNQGNVGPETILPPPNPKVTALLAAGQPLTPNPPGSVNQGNNVLRQTLTSPPSTTTTTTRQVTTTRTTTQSTPLLSPKPAVITSKTSAASTSSTGESVGVTNVVRVPRPTPSPSSISTQTTTVTRNQPATRTSTVVSVNQAVPIVPIAEPRQVEEYKNALFASIINSQNSNEGFRNYVRNTIMASNPVNNFRSYNNYNGIAAVGAPTILHNPSYPLDAIAIGGDAIVIGGGSVKGQNIFLDVTPGASKCC